MRHQIATTPEQSQRLVLCGVNPDSADMFYTNYTTKANDKAPIVKTVPLGIRKDLTPAWSLFALLELLPRQINDCNLETTLVLSPSRYSKGWIIKYIDGDVSDTLHSFRGFSLIEGCVLVIEWLTANGYTLNTK